MSSSRSSSSSSSVLSPPLMVEPEVHVIGEIVGAEFPGQYIATNAFAGWECKAGKEWTLVGGDEKGQTQVDYPEDNEMVIWNHPIDLHFYTRSLAGWPQLVFEVGRLDMYGGKHLVGYGFTYVPCSSGSHEVEVDVWRPCGTPMEEVLDYYLGGGPSLVDQELIWHVNRAKEDRCHLFTQSMGTIYLQLDVMVRNFHLHKIKNSDSTVTTN